jgi:hypothetical protein
MLLSSNLHIIKRNIYNRKKGKLNKEIEEVHVLDSKKKHNVFDEIKCLKKNIWLKYSLKTLTFSCHENTILV